MTPNPKRVAWLLKGESKGLANTPILYLTRLKTQLSSILDTVGQEGRTLEGGSDGRPVLTAHAPSWGLTPVAWDQLNLGVRCSWSVGSKEMLVSQVKSAPKEYWYILAWFQFQSKTYDICPNLNSIVLSENFLSNVKRDIQFCGILKCK